MGGLQPKKRGAAGTEVGEPLPDRAQVCRCPAAPRGEAAPAAARSPLRALFPRRAAARGAGGGSRSPQSRVCGRAEPRRRGWGGEGRAEPRRRRRGWGRVKRGERGRRGGGRRAGSAPGARGSAGSGERARARRRADAGAGGGEPGAAAVLGQGLRRHEGAAGLSRAAPGGEAAGLKAEEQAGARPRISMVSGAVWITPP